MLQKTYYIWLQQQLRVSDNSPKSNRKTLASRDAPKVFLFSTTKKGETLQCTKTVQAQYRYMLRNHKLLTGCFKSRFDTNGMTFLPITIQCNIKQDLSKFLFCTFHFDHIPFWSYSILITFLLGHIPFWSHSVLITIHFVHISNKAHSILITFHFDHIPI